MKILISISKITDHLNAGDKKKYEATVALIAKLVDDVASATGTKKKALQQKLVKARYLKQQLSKKAHGAVGAKKAAKRDAAFKKANPEVATLKEQFTAIQKKQAGMTSRTHHLDFTDAQRKTYDDLSKKLVEINKKLVQLGHGNKNYEADLRYNPD